MVNRGKIIKRLLAFFFLGVASACQADILKELKCHDEVVAQGAKKLRVARQVSALFGETSRTRYYESMRRSPRAWTLARTSGNSIVAN